MSPRRARVGAVVLPAVVLLLVALGSACATGSPGAPVSGFRFHEADARLPPASALPGEAARIWYQDALATAQRGAVAHGAGEVKEARAAWAAAAQGLASLVDRSGPSAWQVALRYRAAELFLQAQAWSRAGEEADRTAADPAASERSRALALRLAAHAWLHAADQDVKAGRLAPPSLRDVDGRRGEPLAPRVPPGAWGRFVAAADGYLGRIDSDPALALAAAERGLLAPGRLALAAAQVQYAHDNPEEARRRLEAILRRWAGDGELLDQALPLYLQTFLVVGDREGHDAALQRVAAARAAPSTARRERHPGEARDR